MKLHKTLSFLCAMVLLGAGCANTATESSTHSLFIGDGFTFEYPSELVANDQGLWTAGGYEQYLNPPENCSVCVIPYVEIGSSPADQDLDAYIIEDLALPGATLEETRDEIGLYHFDLDLGDNTFTKITVREMHDTTAYYTVLDDRIIWFKVSSVFWNVDETDELVPMLLSLQATE